MKTIDLNNYGVQEMNTEVLKVVNGGAGWSDFFWMYAEDIVKLYASACGAVIKGYENGTITNVGSKR